MKVQLSHHMLRFKLKQLIDDKEFKEERRVTLGEINKATGIHRTTLSKIMNQKGYNTSTDVVDRLLTYFDCEPNDLFERVE